MGDGAVIYGDAKDWGRINSEVEIKSSDCWKESWHGSTIEL